MLLLIILIAGCGDVEWFPPYVRLATTPDNFTFATKSNTPLNSAVTSDPITVSGITGDSSPIKITGSQGSNSKYSINNGTPTAADGTVKNGDKVTVTHTSAATLGTPTTSNLTIGTVTQPFTSITLLVQTPLFTAPIQVGASMQSDATIVSVDGVAGTHVISIKDSIGSADAVFSVSDANFNPTFFTQKQTVPVLNGLRIFVRNLVVNVNNGVTTTITIDGADYPVNLTP